MKRRTALFGVVVALALGALAFWLAGHTYWEDVKVPLPPRGEALVNPFFAAQRFAEGLGVHATWDRTMTVPPPDSAIVLSGWHWGIVDRQREALERWVENGGRLVVDASLTGTEKFERWSGIERRSSGITVEPFSNVSDGCDQLREYTRPSGPGGAEHGSQPLVAGDTRSLCNANRAWTLKTSREPEWRLGEGSRVQALRVRVGRGSVTVINAVPFTRWQLLAGNHAWLLVAAAELRKGDDLHFVSAEEHPSLVALAWQYGSPVIVLAGAIVALLLWRGGVRFGPLAPVPPTARRSLAEQIRGTAGFLLRNDAAESLHHACVRALEEAARRRIPGYSALSRADRATALGRVTGFESHALGRAMYHPGAHQAQEIRGTIALLETARRAIARGTIHDPDATR